MTKGQIDLINIFKVYTNESYYNTKYGIYFNDKPVYLGNSNVYKSVGIAIRRISEETGATKEEINQLMAQGIIDIRKMS